MADDKAVQRVRSYGFFGSHEFNTNRREILNAYFEAKAKNKNREVRTEHGPAAEARFRKWLEDTLPKKFGVTSGYIIPDVMAPQYPLQHFDVIIYDALEAPILWVDGNEDMSSAGRRRAIPARYVRAVYEVKATLTAAHAKDAMSKLGSLDPFAKQFAQAYHSAIIFFELPEPHEGRDAVLSAFAPLHHFAGALVLHCPQNAEASGRLTVLPTPGGTDVPQMNLIRRDLPLVKDVDTLNIYLNEEGNIVLGERDAGITAFYWTDGWHVSVEFGCTRFDDLFTVRLGWSKNAFATFFLEMLARLNGEPVRKMDSSGPVFGQVFDVLSVGPK